MWLPGFMVQGVSLDRQALSLQRGSWASRASGAASWLHAACPACTLGVTRGSCSAADQALPGAAGCGAACWAQLRGFRLISATKLRGKAGCGLQSSQAAPHPVCCCTARSRSAAAVPLMQAAQGLNAAELRCMCAE